jgi:outer membrane protein TolC
VTQAGWRVWVRVAGRLCLAWACIGMAQAQPAPAPAARPLLVDEVLASVVSRYPPLLAALIEQDIAAGRLRQAEGAFDLNLNAGLASTPLGYYDGRTGSVILEQALQSWGAKVYGGYRLASGFLPNYNLMRTPEGGQLTAGVKINLLRDGRIDKDRAAQAQARLGEAAADPLIARQRLDFVRAATVAYYNWLGAGLRLSAAESLLRVANDRDAAVAEQVKRGAIAPIVRIDNERLVISRKLAAIQAQRRFEATAIELSLFLRDGQDRPSIAARERLPAAFPGTADPDGTRLQRDIADALARRPETRGIAVSIERLNIERDLARNELLPSLDVGIEARQSPMQRRQPDIEALETKLGVEFNLPLQRRAAAGRLQTIEGQLLRLRTEEQFARERIETEVRDAYSALAAVVSQISQARRNVVLAETLEQAERLRFSQGATDLFALQIREQATFDARLGEIDAFNEYQRSLANYRAAVANDGQETRARR